MIAEWTVDASAFPLGDTSRTLNEQSAHSLADGDKVRILGTFGAIVPVIP